MDRKKAWRLGKYTILNPSWGQSCVLRLIYHVISGKQPQRPLREECHLLLRPVPRTGPEGGSAPLRVSHLGSPS